MYILKSFSLILCLFAYSLAHGQPQSTKTRIITYNIRRDLKEDKMLSWKHRKSDVNAMINFYQPEILCVQEALYNQILDLNHELTSYNHVGIGRLDGIHKGEFAAIFYKKEKYTKIDDGNFWLSETSNKPSIGWDAAYTRICSWVKLYDLRNNKYLFVFNTHLDNIGTIAQKKSVSLIYDKIQELTEKEKLNFVLTGDFNLTPDKEPIKYLSHLMNDSQKVSQITPYGPEGTFNGFDFYAKLKDRLDYIFVQKNIVVKRYAVLTDSKNQHFFSDHLPVLVDIKF